MKIFLTVAQIFIATSLVLIILSQAQGTGIGTVFGGGGGFYRSKRGIEKLFVYITITLAVLFLIVSLLQVAL